MFDFKTLEEQVSSWFKDFKQVKLSIFKNTHHLSDNDSNFVYKFNTDKGIIPIGVLEYNENLRNGEFVDGNLRLIKDIYKYILDVIKTIHDMGIKYDLDIQNDDLDILQLDNDFLTFSAEQQIEHISELLEYHNKIIPIEPETSLDDILKNLEEATEKMKNFVGSQEED